MAGLPNFRNAVAITPDDATDISGGVHAIMVTVAGDVKVTTVGGGTVVLPLLAKTVLDLGVQRVWATGTTATGIFGFTR